jgi:hypothetical protein
MKIFFFRITVLLVLFSMNCSFVKQANQFFVQFRVTVISDSDAALVVDAKMKSKSGIIESRTDHVTSTYFCLLSPDADYTKENFENWFAKLGYSISCYNRGLQNTDMMISPHILKDCVDENK